MVGVVSIMNEVTKLYGTMTMQGGSIQTDLLVVGTVVVFFVLIALYLELGLNVSSSVSFDKVFPLTPYLKFIYVSFLKPHTGKADGGQQSALESFYSAQASVYDRTRHRLLRGREDLIGLVAAQLQLPTRRPSNGAKPVWFDIGGGTGYNIEIMDKILDGGVGSFFDHVYLIDLSPSLCEVARERAERLGWKNVTVLCQDARTMGQYHSQPRTADLITMSYSLSMIPDFYSVIDQVASLLAPRGIFGICDFYVQSVVDVSSRNWTGGSINRHVNWFGRMFWRTWFDADRVNLDAGRRDYVEYKFGTILSASERNYLLGGIPYYLFVGCHITAETDRQVSMHGTPNMTAQDSLERYDAFLTESPYLSPKEYRAALSHQASTPPQPQPSIRSKSYESALVNLSSNLPLPSTFYQLHPWRTTYPELHAKHAQFASDYIYAFNWEDPAVDLELLNLRSDDVLVTITSAGDNILDYLSQSPLRRVHAIDLNPNQNHLLELKVAAFSAGLSYGEVWAMFGEGRLANFRDLLIHKLSPHLSSHAFQFWLSHTSHFSPSSRGLYAVSGGSRHAMTLCRWLFRLTRLSQKVRTLCSVGTLAEQKEIWQQSIRKVILSRPLHAMLVSTDWWCWKAAGVPPEQRALIVNDYAATLTPEQRRRLGSHQLTGEAIFKFLVDTLDPVINHTLLSKDNYFYHLVLQGKYSRTCAPRWLGERSWRKLSREGGKVFDGLRIHTDEFLEVVKRMRGGSAGAVIVMDSMDWLEVPDMNTVKHVKFSDRKQKHDRSRSQSKSRSTEGTEAAQTQIEAIHRVLRVGGRVLLRSAALRPWYIELFERMEDDDTGEKLWKVKCMGRRDSGKCIDRVNMYASCWIIVKAGEGTPVGSPVLNGGIKSALKRRRTGSASGSGSDGSFSSGSDRSATSPQTLRGRNLRVNVAKRIAGEEGNDDDGDETETEKTLRSKRGLMEDIMLPGAAMDDANGDRF
ncbi:hypothetical protein LTR05_007537 [Lithohypha guttulata]|uniref:Methyltransferase domain-containing protein n=1 Tax=Lithohypha guttulata TaxID=1690604 RepID=A0AAN7Y971_9EURO|nr:hypothetical protein LTR05_007537 [Lithohypha guttulata]